MKPTVMNDRFYLKTDKLLITAIFQDFHHLPPLTPKNPLLVPYIKTSTFYSPKDPQDRLITAIYQDFQLLPQKNPSDQTSTNYPREPLITRVK